MPQPPVTFALHTAATGRDPAVLAIGMSLPDGGALTVDWRAGRAGTVGVWSSPQAAAAAHRAELVWYGRRVVPAQPAGPPNASAWRWAS